MQQTNLQKLLKEREISARKLSRMAGLSQRAVLEIVKGNQRPRYKTAGVIAKTLNVNVSDIFDEIF